MIKRVSSFLHTGVVCYPSAADDCLLPCLTITVAERRKLIDHCFADEQFSDEKQFLIVQIQGL